MGKSAGLSSPTKMVMAGGWNGWIARKESIHEGCEEQAGLWKTVDCPGDYVGWCSPVGVRRAGPNFGRHPTPRRGEDSEGAEQGCAGTFRRVLVFVVQASGRNAARQGTGAAVCRSLCCGSHDGAGKRRQEE